MKANQISLLLSLALLSLAPPAALAASGQSKCGGIAQGAGKSPNASFDPDLPADQDVFSFCAMGYPPHCWVGVNPIAGTWKIVSNYCFNPRWTSKYEQICPKGLKPGTWKGGNPMEGFQKKGNPRTPDGLEDCDHLMEGF